MEQRYGPGPMNTCPPTPASDYQTAADRWYRAREMLAEALRLSNEASARLQEAQREEQGAWASLEDVAGRSQTKQGAVMVPMDKPYR
jgi:hypothetical protein